MRLAHAITIVACLVASVPGCANYKPAPISPAQNARSLENRSLDNPRLRHFIAAELGGEAKASLAPSWNLSTLSLAAIYYHPDIEIAHAKLAVAQARVITARQHPNPSLSLANVFGTAAVAAAAPPAGVAAITIGPVIDFLVDTFGKREKRTARAQQLADAARWDLATAGWHVRARVRATLLDLWSAQQRLTLSQRQLDLQHELLRLLEQRFAIGEASSVDVMRARVGRAQKTLEIRGLEQSEMVARTQLATALGIPIRALDGTSLSLAAFDQPPLLPASVDAGRLRQEALTMRTDIQASLRQYEATQSALQLQTANQYPNVIVSPGYNYDFGINKYMLGLRLGSLPIFHHNQGRIAQALARRQQAAASFDALQAQIIGQIDQAAAAYRAATRSVATGDALLAEDRRRESQIESQFRVGQVDRATLVTTQLSVATTALARFDAVMQQRRAIGALEDALQQPLFDPGHWPLVPSQTLGLESREEAQ